MKCSNVPTMAREAIRNQIEAERRKAHGEVIEFAKQWLQDDGMPQVLKAVLTLVYYTLHMKRPRKGFDSKRGIESFHRDLVQMMDDCVTEYNFKTDDDAIFVCNYWLKQIGVNLDEMEMPIGFKFRWSGPND